MGGFYRAHDTRLGRDVAIKKLVPGLYFPCTTIYGFSERPAFGPKRPFSVHSGGRSGTLGFPVRN
jgi:hypothetical protein